MEAEKVIQDGIRDKEIELLELKIKYYELKIRELERELGIENTESKDVYNV